MTNTDGKWVSAVKIDEKRRETGEKVDKVEKNTHFVRNLEKKMVDFEEVGKKGYFGKVGEKNAILEKLEKNAILEKLENKGYFGTFFGIKKNGYFVSKISFFLSFQFR